jgi:hypothetical protein
MKQLAGVANDSDYQREIRIRVRSTGQVIDMAPAPARAMILGGTAEEVTELSSRKPETMAMGGGETAVAPAQSPSQKPRGRKA